MRIDKRLRRAGLSTREICFIECWGSLSHKDSLDTDRVSFNNILNAINEILYLNEASRISKREKKRRFVAQELLQMLQPDIALRDPRFKEIPARLKQLLEHKNALNDHSRSPIEKKRGLMENFFKELITLLKEHYISINISLLQTELTKGTQPSNEEYASIISICNNIMSFMLTLGIPLIECHLLYSRTLLRGPQNFTARFHSWHSKIDVKEDDYRVIFTLENDKLYSMLNVAGALNTFNGCNYTTLINSLDIKIAKVEIPVKSYSALAAKEKSEIILKDSLDVVAYMLGSGQINKHQSFNVIDSAGNIVEIDGYSNEILTNSDRLTLQDFGHFMEAMTTLFSKTSYASSLKVSAAFRFLRNGLISQSSEENRFSAYWSALESLTLGVSSDNMDHDEHVVHTTAACMGFDYVIKQLIAIRGISKTLNLQILSQNGNTVTPGSCALGEIYTLLKDDVFIQDLNLKLSSYPYSLYTIIKFAQLCSNPKDMGAKIISHAEKVERHIFRLYILRNAIAHNAESNPYILFLTANLEHYLRETITAMFYTSSMIETVNSAESAFQRYLDLYEITLNELEPFYERDKQEQDLIKGMIVKGDLSPKDEKLQQWINLHH